MGAKRVCSSLRGGLGRSGRRTSISTRALPEGLVREGSRRVNTRLVPRLRGEREGGRGGTTVHPPFPAHRFSQEYENGERTVVVFLRELRDLRALRVQEIRRSENGGPRGQYRMRTCDQEAMKGEEETSERGVPQRLAALSVRTRRPRSDETEEDSVPKARGRAEGRQTG